MSSPQSTSSLVELQYTPYSKQICLSLLRQRELTYSSCAGLEEARCWCWPTGYVLTANIAGWEIPDRVAIARGKSSQLQKMKIVPDASSRHFSVDFFNAFPSNLLYSTVHIHAAFGCDWLRQQPHNVAVQLRYTGKILVRECSGGRQQQQQQMIVTLTAVVSILRWAVVAGDSCWCWISINFVTFFMFTHFSQPFIMLAFFLSFHISPIWLFYYF